MWAVRCISVLVAVSSLVACTAGSEDSTPTRNEARELQLPDEVYSGLANICGPGSRSQENGETIEVAGCKVESGETWLRLSLHATIQQLDLLFKGGAPEQIEFCLFSFRATNLNSFSGLANAQFLIGMAESKRVLQLDAVAPTATDLVSLLDRFRVVVAPTARETGGAPECIDVPPRLGGPPMDYLGGVPPT